MSRRLTTSFVRNFVFGVEDSLVSTVGLLSGVAASGADKGIIILTGVVLVFVEAFSMAVGSFLSENSAKEYEFQKDLPSKKSVSGGVVMFVSYFLSGFIPLSPYFFFERVDALLISIGASLIALFILGIISGSLSKVRLLKSGIQMSFIGGMAILIGAAVGYLLNGSL